MIKRQQKSKVQSCIKEFLRDETGAITVEWVILTAGVIALSIVHTVRFHSNLMTAQRTNSILWP